MQRETLAQNTARKKAKMVSAETFTTANATALVEAYDEAKIDDECDITIMPEGIREGVLHLPCASSVIAKDLMAEARRVMALPCGRAYVEGVRKAASVWRDKSPRSFKKLKMMAKHTKTWLEGRIARRKLIALLSKRACRSVARLERLLKKTIQPIIDSIETLQWLKAIALGDL